jgi:hypothetical protein
MQYEVCKCGKQSQKVENDPNLFAETISVPQLLDVLATLESDVYRKKLFL